MQKWLQFCTLSLFLMADPYFAQAEQPALSHEDSAKSQARELANTAQQRRDAGDIQRALDLYKQAYAVYPSPYLLWPQADLYLLTDHPAEARDALIRHESAFPRDAYPPGQGPAEIQAFKDKIAAREAELRAAQAPKPPAGRGEVPAPVVKLAVQKEAAAPRSPLLWRLGWASVGGAALLLGGGGISLGLREQQVGLYNDDTTCLAGGNTRQENCGDHIAAADQARSAAIATFVIGGALAGTAVALLVIGRSRSVSRKAAMSR